MMRATFVPEEASRLLSDLATWMDSLKSHDYLPPHTSRTAAAAALPLVRSRAQGAPSLKIGVLNDMSGPYQATGGPTSVVCCKQALEDFGVAGKGLNVEVVNADHQNKPDLAVTIARQWYDRDGVDMILDVPTSSVALAVHGRGAREEQDLHLLRRGATSDLTGKACSPNIVHWTYDTYMLAKSTGGAMVKAGGDTWYFLTADYAFGKQLAGRHHRASSRRRAARCSAHRPIRSPAPPTSRRSWCRRSRAARRCWACAMPAPTR